jgi:UDP-N-acetylglucosamine--N-acetylmuramyl-(pentapeptide) pyrophosphoryl-undecaprenol N-acetylglucosamine transferase
LGEQDATSAREAFGLEPGVPTLLAMGGSRGAHSINMAVSGALTLLLQGYQVIHVTGQQDAAAMRAQRDQLPAEIRRRYRPYAFLHDDMIKAMAAADVIVCRSGASVLGEIPCGGLAAILVPYAGGHRDQQRNAQYLAERGAAVIIDDAELSPSVLLETVDSTMKPETLASMRQAAAAMAKRDAAATIGQELSAIARR